MLGSELIGEGSVEEGYEMVFSEGVQEMGFNFVVQLFSVENSYIIFLSVIISESEPGSLCNYTCVSLSIPVRKMNLCPVLLRMGLLIFLALL